MVVRRIAVALQLSVVLVVSGCTRPGETTGVAASAGGVLGAGLGAIVGNQTGDPGSGLLVGAVAGSATGAAIGNAFEYQQQQIDSQAEVLRRQEQQVQAQRNEVHALRETAPDLPPGRSETAATVQPRAAFRWQPSAARSPECLAAEREVAQATMAVEDADKLFHYRRALRLCPDVPEYHVELGELYRRLGRRADAEFEFKEALRLDPRSEAARNNLAAVAVQLPN